MGEIRQFFSDNSVISPITALFISCLHIMSAHVLSDSYVLSDSNCPE